jgi:predicted RNA binding protein YcfA (HicA-like mRNA interferase family)
MPKLPSFKPREIVAIFKKLGYTIHRQRGSHVVMYHTQLRLRAVIPMHTKDIKQGTLKALLKQTNTSDKMFLRAAKK